ncbi:hypothetical protein CH292_13390 [Rhodococcus sp. 14-2470-1a]|nr:hypothetical protein CH292_13390 [Rhodococcus sp. 14-2470-1a]
MSAWVMLEQIGPVRGAVDPDDMHGVGVEVQLVSVGWSVAFATLGPGIEVVGQRCSGPQCTCWQRLGRAFPVGDVRLSQYLDVA